MQKLANILLVILCLIVFITSVIFGGDVKGVYQLEIYKTLLTVSSIVFAVMGAWLSLLKVEIIQGVGLAKTDEDAESNIEKARSLVSPMSSSVVIIALCLLFVFSYYTLKEVSVIHQHIIEVRRTSFVILSLITLWQMVSLLKVMFAGVDFLIDVSRKSKDLAGDRRR